MNYNLEIETRTKKEMKEILEIVKELNLKWFLWKEEYGTLSPLDTWFLYQKRNTKNDN